MRYICTVTFKMFREIDSIVNRYDSPLKLFKYWFPDICQSFPPTKVCISNRNPT